MSHVHFYRLWTPRALGIKRTLYDEKTQQHSKLETDYLFGVVIMSEASLEATLQLSEELLCRPPEQRNEDDILRILPWIRHKSSLFKNLEDGKIKYAEFVFKRTFY